jgi:vacuolar-type H+-ATPase subunit F/Vma7
MIKGFVNIRRHEKVISRGDCVTSFRLAGTEVVYFVGWYDGALRLNFWLYR